MTAVLGYRSSDPFGLGELLYAFSPADVSPIGPGVLLAAGSMSMTLIPDSHDGCGVSTFCRNPLHPGPCKGWKRGLGQIAPGALTAIEKARKDRVAANRVKRAAAKSEAEGKLTPAQLASPLHAKKAINKKAHVLLGNTPDKASRKTDRVILNKGEIARYSKIKGAHLNLLAAKHGVKPLQSPDGDIAQALAMDNASGRDIEFRGLMDAYAQAMASRLAKKLCKDGDGDCDGKLHEGLRDALTEGFRKAVTTGDDSDLDKLVADRKSGTLLTPHGKEPYVPTAPKAPRPAAPAPVRTPVKPGTAPGNAAMTKAADSTLVSFVKMHGSTGKGAPAVAELKRRGLDPDGNPLPKPAPKPNAPAAPSAPAAAPTPSGPAAGAVTPGQPGTKPANPTIGRLTDQNLVRGVQMHGSTAGPGKDAADELKRRGLDLDGKPLAAPAAPSAPAAPAVPKQVTELQDLLATSGYNDRDLLNALNNVTKDEHDKHLTDAQKADIDGQLTAMAGSPDPNVKSSAAAQQRRLAKGNPRPAAPAPAAAPSAPSAPAGNLTPDAQHAMDIANRSVYGGSIAKKQVEAYQKLTKDEFDALPPDVQAKIMNDLKVAEGKFARPDRKKEVVTLQGYLSGRTDANGKPLANVPAAPPAAAPNAPNAPGAVIPTRTGADDMRDVLNDPKSTDHDIAKQASNLGKVEFGSLDQGERDQIGAALNFVARDSGSSVKESADARDEQRRLGLPVTPPRATSAPGHTTPQGDHAANTLARYASLSNGVRMSDADKQAAAVDWDSKSDADKKAYADQFGAKVAAGISQKTQTYTKIDIGDDGRGKLAKEVSDNIQGLNAATPITDAAHAAWSDQGKTPALHNALHGTKLHGLEADFDKVRRSDDKDFQFQLGMLASNVNRGTPEQKKAFEDFRAGIENDASLPLWKRSAAAQHGAEYEKVKSRYGTPSGIALVGQPPTTYYTSYQLDDVYAADEHNLPTVMREALAERRNEMVESILGRGNKSKQQETLTTILDRHPGTAASNADFATMADRVNELGPEAKRLTREAIVEQRDLTLNQGNFSHASAWDSLDSALEGKTFGHRTQNVIDSNRMTSMLDRTALANYEIIPQSEFDQMSSTQRTAAIFRLMKMGQNSPDQDMKQRSIVQAAKFASLYPDYGDNQVNKAVEVSSLTKHLHEPDERAMSYLFLKEAQINGLKNKDRAVLLADLHDIADGRTGPGQTAAGIATRVAAQRKHDKLTNPTYTSAQTEAIDTAQDFSLGDAARLGSYNQMTRADYEDLPKAYRQAVRNDLDTLVSRDPAGAGAVLQKLDSTWAPPAAPKLTVTKSSDPKVTAALDVAYGLDPKGHTTARQMQVYTDLPKTGFDTLQPHEQQTVLADLSYIATTSKAASTKARAEKLLDRFTPPGTTPGTSGTNHAFYPPANSVAGQTRQADPNGAPGLLFKASSPGASGDGHTRTTSGRQGPWGKYGAAGVMLRHVDPATGEERFLMVERGPGISDPGKWQFPGGAIDSNETPYEGATRETAEELGFKYSDFADARVHGHHETLVPNIVGHPNGWKYTSIVATVPTMLKPDLSTHHARAETSDAKWMTRAEIDDLDKKGKMLAPLAGGKIHQNVVSLFPGTATSVARPGPVTSRPPRAKPPAPPAPHKPSVAKNLITDQAARDQLSQDIKGSVRQSFRGKSADERLAAISEMQGFNRTPVVKSKTEIDALLATGDYVEIWRGVTDGGGKTAAEINEEFRSGPSYNGLGVFGNGYYFASDKGIAEAYAAKGYGRKSPGLVRALIPKSAVTEDHGKVLSEIRRVQDGQFQKVHRQGMGGRTLNDEGRYAAAKGMDAITVSRQDYRNGGGYGHLATGPVYVVLNRSILIVEE